ncbi:DUF4190 domain-containing protein [Caloramator sp. mosi_1]|uniref:DUF4190 domain-containing protein n=1 Tax=Caloramator sp. mosi_1 TaxID=3023090 RepID=UPI002360D8F4|nr:DUF4190 domain-containing protein [Caloramator sp. mosi_1]WDC84329.1 DUF4190 domain-containing protein [Caloramator sp. mosi_1]
MKNDGFAVASMVLGIISLVMLFIPFIGWLGIATAIVGLILGINAKNRIKANPQELGGMGMASAGVIMNIVALALIVLGMVACGALIGTMSSL